MVCPAIILILVVFDHGTGVCAVPLSALLARSIRAAGSLAGSSGLRNALALTLYVLVGLFLVVSV